MRLMTNICCDQLSLSKDFYVSLLGLVPVFESEWFIQLSCPNNSALELGLILKNHELVPDWYRQSAAGIYITFVVDNVDSTYDKALTMSVPIEQAPRNEFYGQRRMLVKDPNGCLLDISSTW